MDPAEKDRPDVEPDLESRPTGREPGKVVPLPTQGRPDWLMGPEDDVRSHADLDDGPKRPTVPPPRPRVVKPEPAAAPAPTPAPPEAGAGEAHEAGPEPAPAAEGGAEPPPPAKPAAWAPVASSVPVLHLSLPAASAASPASPAAPPAAGPLPAELPGAAEDRRTPAAPVAAPVPLEEPWWLVALDALRSNRLAQLGALSGLLLVILLGTWLFPRGARSESLARMRRHAEQYDGRTVTVRGRVGDDVFTMGGGYAFYLLQGRDTIVAFTRTGAPVPHATVTVTGQVSTGFLDGVARQALFERAGAGN